MNRESRWDCDLLSITLKVNIKTSVCVNASIRNPNGWMNQEKVKLWFLTINVSCISYHFVKIKNSQNSNRICYQRLILSYLSTALESIQSLLHAILKKEDFKRKNEVSSIFSKNLLQSCNFWRIAWEPQRYRPSSGKDKLQPIAIHR